MRIFFILGSCLAILVSGCVSYKTDAFIVEQASIADMNAHKSIKESIINSRGQLSNEEFAITGHRILNGEGLIIAYRVFKSKMLVDQGQFEKLTIYIPATLPTKGQRIELDENGVTAYWSRGSSNFPGKSGCVGYTTKGYVLFKDVSDSKIEVVINTSIKSISPSGWAKECGEFDFNKVLELKRRDIKTLTPWEGSPGKHIYDESIRE